MRNLNSMRIGSIEDIIKNNEKSNKKSKCQMMIRNQKKQYGKQIKIVSHDLKQANQLL